MFYSYLQLFKNQSNTPRTQQAGFSLVELLVSISILVIVMSVVFVRQGAFNSSVLLRSQAYELALQLREIQLNAVSASGDSGTFRAILGIQLNTDDTTNHLYDIFRDADTDGFFDAGEEYGQQGILNKRFEIREIRAGGNTYTDLAVVFIRPNFDARFFSGPATELSVSAIEIDVALRGVAGTGPDVLRTVEVTSTGQIAVQ